MRFHTLLSFSREQASLNFLWTVRLESHFSFLASTWIEHADLCKVFLLIDVIDLMAVDNASLARLEISRAWSKLLDRAICEISSIIKSEDRVTVAR